MNISWFDKVYSLDFDCDDELNKEYNLEEKRFYFADKTAQL